MTESIWQEAANRLQAENDELRATINGLRNMMRRTDIAPSSWRVTGAEGRMLSMLVRRGGEVVSHEALAEAAALSQDQPVARNTVTQVVLQLRRKLQEHKIMVTSHYGRGYSIGGESLAKAREQMSLDLDVES